MDLHSLYLQGAERWNRWANEQLTEKRKLRDIGAWTSELSDSPTTETWLHNSRADFRGLRRLTAPNFAGYIFPSDADFRGLHFEGNADFTCARFCGAATFNGSTFHKRVKFFETKFERESTFKGAEFAGDANFGKASFPSSHSVRFDQARFVTSADFFETQFQGDTSFRQARFSGPTSFWQSHFHKGASFNAIEAESAFSLANVRFDEVPDFIQSHFPEAPRLDNVQVPAIDEFASLMGRTNPDAAPRYRALKRLALQGHDHDREIRFFADELRSLRHHPDKPWHTRYWAGVLYESVSNFGRSISRPLILLTISTASFAGIYALATGIRTCVTGIGSSASAAIYLAVRKALIFSQLYCRSKNRHGL